MLAPDLVVEPPQERKPQRHYSDAVERWRPLVEKYFAPEDVSKALYVMEGESGGNPGIKNTEGSGATGLFQIMPFHGVDATDPETSVKWAAAQVKDHGWSDWGEGVLYQGKPFGILGFKPFDGSAPTYQSRGVGVGVANPALSTVSEPPAQVYRAQPSPSLASNVSADILSTADPALSGITAGVMTPERYRSAGNIESGLIGDRAYSSSNPPIGIQSPTPTYQSSTVKSAEPILPESLLSEVSRVSAQPNYRFKAEADSDPLQVAGILARGAYTALKNYNVRLDDRRPGETDQEFDTRKQTEFGMAMLGGGRGLGTKAVGGKAAQKAAAEAPDLEALLARSLEEAARKPKAAPLGAPVAAAADDVVPPAASPAPTGDLAAWEYTMRQLEKAKEQGPEAVAAVRERMSAAVKKKQAERQVTEQANRNLRWGNTAKTELAKTSDEMAEAANRARNEPSLLDNPVPAGVPLPSAKLQNAVNAAGGVPVKSPGTILENLVAIPAASKQIQTGGDVLGAQFRQGLPTFFIDPRVWGRNSKRALKAYFEDPAATGVLDEVGKIARFADDDVRRVIMVVDDAGNADALIVPSMRQVLGIGDDFAVPGFEKVNSSLVSRMADQYPLGQRSQKAMQAALVGTATELRNQMIDAAQRAGVNKLAWFEHYGDIAKVGVGYGDVPGFLKGLSNGFYSLRNTAARFQSVTQPFTKPGPVFAFQDKAAKGQGIFSASPRGVATRNLVRFAAGELANLRFLSAAGKFSGLFEVGHDPLGPGFGQITFQDPKGNDIKTDVLGGYGSMIKAMVRSAAAAQDTAEGKEPRYDPVVEWLNFSRYKMAGMPAAVMDTAIAHSALGDAEGMQSPFAIDLADPKTWTGGAWAQWFVPFFTQDSIQGLASGTLDASPGGLMEAGALGLAQWAGIPANLYEETPYGESEERIAAGIKAGELPATFPAPDGTQKPVKSYADLKAASPLAADEFDKKNPELATARAEASSFEPAKKAKAVQDEALVHQRMRDDTLLNTNPAQWRKESGDAAREAGIRIDQIYRDAGEYDREPRSLLDVANKEYHDAIMKATNPATKKPDWDAVDLALAAMSPDKQKLLFENRLKGETPARQQYIRDLKVLVPYFKQRDEAWKELAATDKEWGKFKTFDDYRQSLVVELHDAGYGWAEAEAKAEKATSRTAEIVSKTSNIYLADHLEEVVPLLDKWGYYVPARYRKFVRAQ